MEHPTKRLPVERERTTISMPPPQEGQGTSPALGLPVPAMVYSLFPADQDRYPAGSAYWRSRSRNFLTLDSVALATCLPATACLAGAGKISVARGAENVDKGSETFDRGH